MFVGLDQAADVLNAWREWTRQAPEEVTTSARLLKFPDLELIPEIVRGKSFTIIDGPSSVTSTTAPTCCGHCAISAPRWTRSMLPPAGLSDMHMDPVHPIPYLSAHSLVDGLPANAIDDAVAIAGPGFDSLVAFELRHGGGALSRMAPGHGAMASVPGEYLTFMVALVLDPAEVPVLEADLARLAGVFPPYDVGRYLNFTEQPDDVEAMFPAGTLPRLRELKAKYDSDNVIRANHEINGSRA
jgi:Berberine and berberine like